MRFIALLVTFFGLFGGAAAHSGPAISGCDQFLTHSARYQRLPLAQSDSIILHDVDLPGDELVLSEEPIRPEQRAEGLVTPIRISILYRPDRSIPGNVAKGDIETLRFDERDGPALKIQRVFLDNTVKDANGIERRIPKFLTDPTETSGPEAEKVRTSVFANLLAFKHALTEFGAAKRVVLSWIVNFHTVMELNIKERIWLRDHKGEKMTNEIRANLVAGTALYRYAEEVIEATGHRIREVKIGGGELQPYSTFLSYQGATTPNEEQANRIQRNSNYFYEGRQKPLAKGLSLRESDLVFRNFYLTFELEKWDLENPER